MSNPARQALRAYEAEAWRRWEMGSVEPVTDAGETTEAIEEPEATLPPQVLEEIARLKEEARQAGFAEGLARGQKKGFEQGHGEGLAKGVEEGRKQGLEAGTQEALKQGRSKNAQEAAQLASLLESSAQALLNIEAETGQALIRLAISISQQVIRSTLAVEPEKILDTIHDVLHLDGGHEGLLRLRLHPDDLALVQEHLTDDPAARHWRLQGDPAIERGGCIAETTLGNIDATLQTRWQRVVDALGHSMPWSVST